MSVLSCKLMSANATLSMDSSYRRVYTHDFQIKTDDKWDMQPDVFEQSLNALPDPIPAMWSSYSSFGADHGTGGPYLGDNDVFVQDRKYRRANPKDGEDWKTWICTVTWKYPEFNGFTSANPPDINPINDPVRLRIDGAPYQRIADKDKDGNPILNGAKDPFNPPLVIDDDRPVLVAKRNWAGTDFNGLVVHILNFRKAVNTDTFYGAGARQALVENIICGDLQERNGVTYYPVTYRIQFNENAWDFDLVNQGRQHLDANGNKQYPVRTQLRQGAAQGSTSEADYDSVIPREYLDIVALNADGTRKYPDDALADYVSPAFRVYKEQAFSGLGIGGT